MEFPQKCLLAGLLLSCCLNCGCSIMIANTGRYQCLMRNRASKSVVHAYLGEPDHSGQLPANSRWTGATDYEIYYVRGPVYSYQDVIGAGMFFGMTFGIGELYAFPAILMEKLTGPFRHYSIWYTYFPDGTVRSKSVRLTRISPDRFGVPFHDKPNTE